MAEIDSIGAVLTYTTSGRSGVHGTTIGANGQGTHAVLFVGDPYEAELSAEEWLNRLKRGGYHITEAAIVPKGRSFSGQMIRVVDAPLKGMATSDAL